jgi:hypothetical protein
MTNSFSDHSSTVLVTNTNVIVWKVDDEKTLTICHQFNPNPETCTGIASVVAFQSDNENVPVKNGILMQFDYDLQSDRFTRLRGNGCNCLRERLEKIFSQQRESIANWLQEAKEKSKDDLERCIFDPDLCHEGMIGYHELIPGDLTDRSKPFFTAGTILIHNAVRWWVADMYCASPECNCYDTLLVFHPVHDLDSTTQDAVCVDYKLRKSYSIREIDKGLITPSAAHDLFKYWLDNKPVWFTDDEIKSRSRQMKRVMARTMQYRAAQRAREGRYAKKAGRNDPCPCGSGKKFKVCCG